MSLLRIFVLRADLRLRHHRHFSWWCRGRPSSLSRRLRNEEGRGIQVKRPQEQVQLALHRGSAILEDSSQFRSPVTCVLKLIYLSIFISKTRMFFVLLCFLLLLFFLFFSFLHYSKWNRCFYLEVLRQSSRSFCLRDNVCPATGLLPVLPGWRWNGDRSREDIPLLLGWGGWCY